MKRTKQSKTDSGWFHYLESSVKDLNDQLQNYLTALKSENNKPSN